MLVREALCWHRADGESPGKQLGSTSEPGRHLWQGGPGEPSLEIHVEPAVPKEPPFWRCCRAHGGEHRELSPRKGAWEIELGKPSSASGTRKVSPWSQEQRPGAGETCTARLTWRVVPGLSPSPVLLHTARTQREHPRPSLVGLPHGWDHVGCWEGRGGVMAALPWGVRSCHSSHCVPNGAGECSPSTGHRAQG